VNNQLKEKLSYNSFNFDHENCSGEIIDAHSIQKSGGLTIISEKQGNELKVIGFQYSGDMKKKIDIPISINTASTFRGFCHNQDDIFSGIEKKSFDGSTEQMFL
jgi:hypothetical protein